MTIGKRCQLYVHPAGAVAAAASLLFLPSRTVLSAALALMLHEAGHMAALWLCGVRAWRFELTPFGGMADVKAYNQLRPLCQAAAAAAGVAVSLAGALLCMLMLHPHPLICELTRAQLSLAFVNCLPAWPLDGARVLVAMAACFGAESGMRRALAWMARCIGAAFAALGLWGAWMGECSWPLLLAGPYLWYAAREGSTAEQVRRLACMQKRKLAKNAVMPLSAYACTAETAAHVLGNLLSRFSSERYHLLVQLGEDGKVKQVLTEEEVIRQVFTNNKD